MLRPLAALVGLAVLVGCGASDLKAHRGPPPCPAGTPELTVRDILPTPPPGTEILRSDPKDVKPVKDSMRTELGDTLRSVYSRVVAKRGRILGTGVIVVNLDQDVDPRETVRGAMANADDFGADAERLTIAGEQGVLVVGPDGAGATGVVGECTAVTLTGQNEAEVRAVAEKIQRAE